LQYRRQPGWGKRRQPSPGSPTTTVVCRGRIVNPMPDNPASTVYRRPLAVCVVWHPASETARPLAHALFRHLCQDPKQPLERGLQIPVRFRSEPGLGETALPAPLPLDPMDLTSPIHTAIVMLVDDEMSLERDKYGVHTPRRCRVTARPRPAHTVSFL
jgi:hypothetical protein